VPRKKIRARQVKRLAETTAVEAGEVIRPKGARPAESAGQLAVEIARVMHEDQCEDVVVLDLRGASPVCDYFVIGTGTSDRQMRAVADHVEERAEALGDEAYGQAGYQEATWIIVDFVDVVVHLFGAEHRGYYDLESLWGDCPTVDWASERR